MTETRSGADGSASDGDLRSIVDGHTQSIDELRRDVANIQGSQKSLEENMIAMRAESQEWRRGSDRRDLDFRSSIDALTREIATSNGAEAERNRIKEDRTQLLKRAAVVIGILCTIGSAVGGTLFSSQTFDTAFWGHFRTHPHIEAQINATPNH